MTIPFEFTEPSTYCEPIGSFVLKIPNDIQSKTDLFTAIASAGRFPDYFGNNWDAVFDCVRDFGWIPEKQIVILHGDLPMHGNKVECCRYLKILRAAIEDWTAGAGRTNIDTAAMGFVDHELLVVFPADVRTGVLSLLKD